MSGAIGQPDAHAGELPCVYVELVKGATATVADLLAHAASHIHERAAVPKYIEVLAELPKTAVGKVFKPDLRRMAITRVYDAALKAAGTAGPGGRGGRRQETRAGGAAGPQWRQPTMPP